MTCNFNAKCMWAWSLDRENDRLAYRAFCGQWCNGGTLTHACNERQLQNLGVNAAVMHLFHNRLILFQQVLPPSRSLGDQNIQNT